MTQETIQEVVARFASDAQTVYGSALREVILYGSCARGDFASDSDIDILALLDVPQDHISRERKKMQEISNQLDLDYDVVLAPVFQSAYIFDRYLPVSRYYQNVKTEGVRYA